MAPMTHYGGSTTAHQTPKNKRVVYAAFHLLDDTQLWYHRRAHMRAICAAYCCSIWPAAPEGANDNDILFMTYGDGDSTLSTDDASSARGTAVCNIIGASDDEVVLRSDESMDDVLGGIPVSDGVGLSVGDLPNDGSTDILLHHGGTSR
jgi:hypothetical protein